MSLSISTSRFPSPRIAAVVCIGVAAFGLAVSVRLYLAGQHLPLAPSENVFQRLFAGQEPLGLFPLIIFSLLLFELATTRSTPSLRSGSHFDALPNGATLSRSATWVVVALVLGAALFGTYVGMGHVALSMDEYNADFEARILHSGQFRAPVPEEWQRFVEAIKPIFVSWNPTEGTWLSTYLPGYAVIRAAVARTTGVAWVTNPLLAALSIPLIAVVSNQLWPGKHWRAILSVCALATSSQFLAMSVTAYAMSAHLVLNLVFLCLYLRGDRWGIRTAPVVGALALGMHNPFPHALFVAPFLVRLLRQRRFALLTWWLLVYGVASAIYLTWLIDVKPIGDRGGLLSLFAIPGVAQWFLQGMNLVLTLSWQSPIVALMTVTALLRVRCLGEAERDLAYGVFLTFAFYLLFPSTQGHGWGYRYIFGVLGNAVLLFVTALPCLEHATSPRTSRRLIAASFATSILVQLPSRASAIFAFARPFSNSFQTIASMDAEVVLIETDSIWYGRDLIRNDPLFRAGPIIANSRGLSGAETRALDARFGPRVRRLSTNELVTMGLERAVPPQPDAGAANR